MPLCWKIIKNKHLSSLHNNNSKNMNSLQQCSSSKQRQAGIRFQTSWTKDCSATQRPKDWVQSTLDWGATSNSTWSSRHSWSKALTRTISMKWKERILRRLSEWSTLKADGMQTRAVWLKQKKSLLLQLEKNCALCHCQPISHHIMKCTSTIIGNHTSLQCLADRVPQKWKAMKTIRSNRTGTTRL